ncbi:KH domain-containing protein [Candidatus Peregrinibacteria bacterium]|mgnify:FL=1|jgi:spoIIIJ-associated protein|nr:KH domain-containing protein [Candidatus Peregrinibacteria bacterium]MBT7484485.1 KH domain-containing protein [Candidatus Peregrinibacteria bacterium]MBT7702627.1 KH domain-containing protein [Candidatus Peregrinibacteria bacterium]
MEEIISETLKPLLELMHIPFTRIDVEAQEDNQYRINIEAPDPKDLIGYHGGTLYAIQHLLKILLSKKIDQAFSINLDIDNYRKRQEENVINITEQKIDQIRKDSTSRKLPPMSPYFRRVVHLYLAQPEFEDITTYSEGTGDHRAVVISMV